MRLLIVYMNTAARGHFPIGLTNLASYLEMLGHEVKIFDTTFYKKFLTDKREVVRKDYGLYKPISNPIELEYTETDIFEDLKKEVESFKPQLLGFSILSCQFFSAVDLADRLKEYYTDLPIIFGGLHPSINSEECIAQKSVDMICVGEGEYAMEELLDKMSGNDDYTGVKNIWVKQNGKVYRNGLRRLVDLNELPVLNWSFFSDQHSYIPLNGRMYRMGPVEYGRGCAYSCNYCSCTFLREKTLPQKYLRRKSVEKAISDLIYLKNKYKMEMFYFIDESFLSMPIDTFRVFSKEYKREVGLPFQAMTHPDSVSVEKAELLSDMGCYLVTLGIECGNQEYRKNLLNRNVSNEKLIGAFKILRDNGILASAFGMIGLPFEDRSMIFDTIEAFRSCKPETYAVGIFKPFLGSKLRQFCIDEGFFDTTGENYNYPDTTSILTMPKITSKEIEGLYRTFYLYTKLPRKYFSLLAEAESNDLKLDEAWRVYKELNKVVAC